MIREKAGKADIRQQVAEWRTLVAQWADKEATVDVEGCPEIRHRDADLQPVVTDISDTAIGC